MKGIALDDNGDLLISNGSVVLKDTTAQEVELILTMNQGELKTQPLLGANLIQFLKSKPKQYEVEERVKLHLAMDNKDYHEIRKYIQLYHKVV